MYKIFNTNIFRENIHKQPTNYLNYANKIIDKLIENHFTGDPLKYNFFRKKRIREKRIYFLIYEDLNLILLVATGDKKNQREIIDYIKDNLKQFREMAEKIAKQPQCNALSLDLLNFFQLIYHIIIFYIL